MPPIHYNNHKTIKKLPLYLSGSLGLLLLTGCVVGPDYQKPNLDTGTKWHTASKSTTEKPAQLANWWKNLNDPILNQLIDEAIKGNNDVASAKAKVREARASLWQTSGTLYPSASGSASSTRSKSGSSNAASQYRGGFDASWEIDLFGANRRALEASKYGLDGATEDLRATLVTMIGDITSNYVELRSTQQKLNLAHRTEASQSRTAQLTRDKFAAGAVSQLDVANAEGQLANTQAGIPQMEANLASTMHRLSVLTGKTPTALNERLKASRKIPWPKWPIATGIPANILLTRPDLRVAERQYAKATANIGQAEANRYPSFSLSGNIATSANSVGSLGKNSSLSWSWGPNLSVPIFNAGQRAAAVEVARAQRDQSFIAYRAAVLTALEDVENALISISKEQSRYTKLNKATKSYKQALELSYSLYESGNTSFLELLNAERSNYSAEQSLIESQAAITTNYISLMKALGGGYDGEIDTTRPEIIDGYTGPHLKKQQISK